MRREPLRAACFTGILALGLLAAAASGIGCAGVEPARPPGPVPNKPVLDLPEPPAEPSLPPEGERGFTIVSINDTYRLEGVERGRRGGFARVRSLRTELEAVGEDVLLLHAGDFLYPSLLSRKFDGAQIIDVMNLLDGDGDAFDPRMFVTFGNHEFDKSSLESAPILERRIEQSGFRWLGTNVRFARAADGSRLVDAPNLVDTHLLTLGGVRVGLYSVTTSFGIAAYIQEIGDYVESSRRAVASLRQRGAEVVIGLTHLLISEDIHMLERLGAEGPDLVFGGHEHEAEQAQIDGRWILKADAEAVTAVVARVTLTESRPTAGPEVEFFHAALGPEEPFPDPRILERVAAWEDAYDLLLCVVELALDTGCLDQALGNAATALVAEEMSIRRYETSLGNWIADRMLEHFGKDGAQVALINSGSLRLNQNLPAGSVFRRRHLEELLAYPTELRLLEIDGATLEQVLGHSVSEWSGSGWFLQVAGLAFRHDPASATVAGLTLLDPDGPRPIGPDDKIRVVTTDYLVEPAGGQDGFTMLGPHQQLAAGPDLKDLVFAALRAAGPAGIAPAVEGRICNPKQPGPCLAF